MGYILEEIQHLKKSFSFKRHHGLAIIYDIILFTILVSVGYFLTRTVINYSFSSVMVTSMTGVQLSLMIGFFITLMIMTAIYSFFKMLVWNNVLEQKFHTVSFTKYYLANLIIFFIMIILILISLIFFKPHGFIISAIIALIFTHFNGFFKLHYVRHKSISKALKLSIKKGFMLHEFIFIYIILAFLIYIYIFLYSFLHISWLFFITPILIFILIFWLRNYFRHRHHE